MDSSPTPPPPNPDAPDAPVDGEKTSAQPSRKHRFRRFLPWTVFLAALLVLLFLRRCPEDPPEFPEPDPLPAVEPPPPPVVPDSQPEPEPIKPEPPPQPTKPLPPPPPPPPEPEVQALPDTLPYLYADPWGGRHFDSVAVTLRCREDCVVLYSLNDSLNFGTYAEPVTIRRNTTLWLSGITVRGNTVPPQRIEYVIEKDRGLCAEGMAPVAAGGAETCIDLYEWPNRPGAQPLAEIGQAAAADSCAAVGKRLCRAEEWRAACAGPQQDAYPYGDAYDERHCPAQQREASRSGRNPVCRSYFGAFDMTGNLWEWTSTPAPGRENFFLVAGGSWDTAEKAQCGLSKYSFYPQNRYPFVGFRCCADPGK